MSWSIDAAHSQVGFSVKHMMFATVRGRFGGWSAEVSYDAANPEASTVHAKIDAASIDTGVGDRDNHLRSGDFFNVAEYPELRFASTAVRRTAAGFEVDGELTIRDVTKPVTLAVQAHALGKDPWGNQRVGFHATTKINRKDYGLTWNQVIEAGGVLVGEEITIEIDVQLIGAAA